MPQSDLALTYVDFVGHTGDYLGYGWGAAEGDVAHSSAQLRDINKVIESGQRQVYSPPVLPGERAAHAWSFLRPTASLTLADGETGLDLPRDCGGHVEGEITASTSGNTVAVALQHTNIERLLKARAAQPDRTGFPEMVAVVPLKGTQGGQRFRLEVFPEVDADYTLTFTYEVIPDAISGARPYHYGGAQHTETFLASCIASAELFRDDARGTRWTYFMERLQASVSLDRRARPQTFGQNLDRSQALYGGGGRGRWWDESIVTVNNVTPT